MINSALLIPKRIWIERHEDSSQETCDACDVLVEMENGILYTAVFVTLPHLIRQMDLSYDVSKTLPDVPPVHYAALETPHLIVNNLDRDTIEDTIDNLLALDTFETLFTQVTGDEEEETSPIAAAATPKRATAEVAAVVLNEVLLVQEDTVPAP